MQTKIFVFNTRFQKFYLHLKSLRTSTDDFYNSSFRDYYLCCSSFFLDFMRHTLL